MTHKLILIIKQPYILTSSSMILMWRIKTQNLLHQVPNISRELSSWTFQTPFLSVIHTSSVKIIKNHNDIIKYLQSLPSNKTKKAQTKREFF